MSPLARLVVIAVILGSATLLLLVFGGRNTARSVVRIPLAATPMRATESSLTPPDLAPSGPILPPSASEEIPETNVTAPPPLELSRLLPAWEQQLQQIAANSATSRTAQAQEILALLPALPEEALAEAAERAVERLPDADYARVAGPAVTNPQTHARALSVLFADLMERPDAVTLPALLRIAQNPNHPFSPSARENLELLLGADFGSDWQGWQTAIQRKLAR